MNSSTKSVFNKKTRDIITLAYGNEIKELKNQPISYKFAAIRFIRNKILGFKQDNERRTDPLDLSALITIIKSIELSDNYLNWQTKGNERSLEKLINNHSLFQKSQFFEQLENKSILRFLNKIAKTHIETSLENISHIKTLPKIRIKHSLLDNDIDANYELVRNNNYIHGLIRFNKLNQTIISKSLDEALNVTIHEVTHHIQFTLGWMFEKNLIEYNHPLYKEAEIFYYLDQTGATIDTNIPNAYHAQSHEIDAYAQGKKISQEIINHFRPDIAFNKQRQKMISSFPKAPKI